MSQLHEGNAGALDYLRSLPTYLLPHHLLSRLVLAATRIRNPRVTEAVVRRFAALYDVDLEEAVVPDEGYSHFNAFFTRALKPGARSLDPRDDVLASPVDATVSAVGAINDGRIIQAKGQGFTVQELLGGDAQLAQTFSGGDFATLYLSPRDYHRIHMPLEGRLRASIYIPGRLFSVAPHIVRSVPRLFARNERLVTMYDSPHGPFAMVLVGAIFVACIETVWSGVVTPPHGSRIRRQDYPREGDGAIQLARGAEMGRFNMGSTVILLFPRDTLQWSTELACASPVRMGEAIASFKPGKIHN